MEEMLLIKPTMDYAEEIMAYRQEFIDAGSSTDGCSGLRKFDNAKDWIDAQTALESSETVPEGLVAATEFIYVRKSDSKIVGMINIRHYFNEFLSIYGGHIGYSVCPSERRKGYAKSMLRDALPYCRDVLHLDRVLITCLTDNEGSRRTILSCGGVYDGTVQLPDSDERLERYWIDLA